MNPVGALGLGVLLACMSTAITYTKEYDNVYRHGPTLSEAQYSKIFHKRRIYHLRSIKSVQSGELSSTLGMVRMALEKMFMALRDTTRALDDLKYIPEEGFSMEPPKQEALMLLLEATYMTADMLLHFPRMSYQVLADEPNWRELINWCLNFVDTFPIAEKNTHALVEMTYQQINHDFEDTDNLNPAFEDPGTPMPQIQLSNDLGMITSHKSEL